MCGYFMIRLDKLLDIVCTESLEGGDIFSEDRQSDLPSIQYNYEVMEGEDGELYVVE